jgi:hypothetical protein
MCLGHDVAKVFWGPMVGGYNVGPDPCHERVSCLYSRKEFDFYFVLTTQKIEFEEVGKFATFWTG